jgi:hypothetical protein
MPNPTHESLRAGYCPERIRVYFIGESPPAGGTFFYAANSNLYRYTQAAFARAYRQEWSSDEEFLRGFQALGCYLDDLCLDPVNGLSTTERRLQRAEAVPSLARRLSEADPLAAISVMSGTERNIRNAVRLIRMNYLPLYFMPFPTFGNQHKYVNRLTDTLVDLRREGILGDCLLW